MICLSFFYQLIHDGSVQLVGSGVIELTGHGSVYGHGIGIHVKGISVALYLFFHITKAIQGTLLIKFVECNQICKIQHVNFLQLSSCTVFRSHDIEGHIAVLQYFRV